MTNSPFRLEFPADVLEDEDVAVVGQFLEARLRATLPGRRCRRAFARTGSAALPCRPSGEKISVCSFTPSRIGIMCSADLKPGASIGAAEHSMVQKKSAAVIANAWRSRAA